MGTVLALGAACSDATGPAARGPQLLLAFETAASDTIPQFGVAVTASLSDSARLRGLRLYVDSARTPQPAATNYDLFSTGGVKLQAVVFLPGPGRYTITAAVTDTAGRVTSSSFTRTVTLDSVAYMATALPDLGSAANAVWVHANGTVVGSVVRQDGRVRPAVWQRGQLTIPSATDSADATAIRVNAAGDLLLQYVATPDPTFFRARVLRADGMIVTFAPYLARSGIAAELTDGRQAFGYNPDYLYNEGQAAALDVVAGRADTLRSGLTVFNSAGQAAGTYGAPPLGPNFVMRGLPMLGFPAQPPAVGCKNHQFDPVFTGLDDDGNLTATLCGNLAFLSARGSVWLDRYFGPGITGSARLSRTGGLVAALGNAGVLYVWRADIRRAAQVRLAGAWRVDGLGAINAAGQIAAHGVNAATGRAAALLLSPAAP